MSSSITADPWSAPGSFVTAAFTTPSAMTGCGRLQFSSTLTLQPQSHQAAAPSAYSVDLHIPQSDSPSTLATPHLKKAVVTLPAGVRVSPSAADGLQACSDAQIGIDNAQEASCPEASKLGTVKVKTPLLAEPLEGAIFQGTQTPAHLLRLFLVVKGSGVLIKLAGSVDLDSATGQITTTFDNNPQLPFEDLRASISGSAPRSSSGAWMPARSTSTTVPTLRASQCCCGLVPSHRRTPMSFMCSCRDASWLKGRFVST